VGNGRGGGENVRVLRGRLRNNVISTRSLSHQGVGDKRVSVGGEFRAAKMAGSLGLYRKSLFGVVQSENKGRSSMQTSTREAFAGPDLASFEKPRAMNSSEHVKGKKALWGDGETMDRKP